MKKRLLRNNRDLPNTPLSNLNKTTFEIIQKINRGFGLYEYMIRAPRNTILGTLFFIFFMIHLVRAIFYSHLHLPFLLYPALFLGLTYYARNHKVVCSLKMAEFLRINPKLEPNFFFKTTTSCLGPFGCILPNSLEGPTVEPSSVSFKKHTRSKQGVGVLFLLGLDTMYLAHTSLTALKYVGKDYAREIFDVMASMWGKRILEQLNTSLLVQGAEKIKDLKGKIILILNHKGLLDFALTFFALSHIIRDSGRNLRPRFITAKDHFLDNPFIYSILGVGKLIETVDMVFIERKRKGESIKNFQQAATFLAQKDIEIAIFPQGTRPEGNIDKSGKRRDAGYYTTISRKDLTSDHAHLKKGTAYLAVDSLIELQKQKKQDLHLVFVGIRGTATILPKQSFKMQTEVEVEYEIGDPITLTANQVEGIQKPENQKTLVPEEQKYLELVSTIHKQIDERLIDCLKINKNLHHRFLLDIQGYFRYSHDRQQAIEQNLNLISQKSNIVYQILDRIYICAPKTWNAYLAELAQLLMKDNPTERYKTLCEQISLDMLKGIKSKMHGKTVE